MEQFKSFEDFLKYVSDNNQKALAAMDDWHRRLKCGDCYIRIWDDLIIFGEIIESEYREDRELLRHRPELRLTRNYSIACPEGELGTIYVVDIYGTISKASFEIARSKGWKLQLPVTIYRGERAITLRESEGDNDD